MDQYDEIAEQLKSAQDQGFEALKGRLEAILEALEKTKSSIQDTLSQSADQVFPLGDVTGSVADLRATVEAAETRAADAEAALAQAEAKAAEDAAAQQAGAEIVNLDLLRRFDIAGSQSDLLHDLLSVLAEHVSRAVVLVIRDGGISAWSGIGFVDGSRLEQWKGDVGLSTALQSFVDDPRPMRVSPIDDPVMGDWMAGDSDPEEAVLVPITLHGKTMGAVYADRLADGPWDPDAVQVLLAISCWLIDTLHRRKGMPAPMLGTLEGVGVDADLEAEIFEPDEEPEIEVEIEPDEPTETEQAAAEPALEEMAAEADFDPSVTVQVDVSETPPEPEPSVDDGEYEAEPELPAESEEAAPEDVEEVSADEPRLGVVEEEGEEPTPVDEDEPEAEAEAPAIEVSLPPPVEPVVPPQDAARADESGTEEESAVEMPPEDEAGHEEARRFARLLVSEIKLYNESEVERGRENNDLYLRLKEDIDRSREMYEKRIDSEIREGHDYFQDELVRILAGGEAEALGM